jgi:hypothetical protein
MLSPFTEAKTLPAPDTFAAYRHGQWETVMLRTIHGHHLLLVSTAATPAADATDATIIDAWQDPHDARDAYDDAVLEQTSGTVAESPVADWYGRQVAARIADRH